jgi:DNA-binding MarR family transcriptional regulator
VNDERDPQARGSRDNPNIEPVDPEGPGIDRREPAQEVEISTPRPTTRSDDDFRATITEALTTLARTQTELREEILRTLLTMAEAQECTRVDMSFLTEAQGRVLFDVSSMTRRLESVERQLRISRRADHEEERARVILTGTPTLVHQELSDFYGHLEGEGVEGGIERISQAYLLSSGRARTLLEEVVTDNLGWGLMDDLIRYATDRGGESEQFARSRIADDTFWFAYVTQLIAESCEEGDEEIQEAKTLYEQLRLNEDAGHDEIGMFVEDYREVRVKMVEFRLIIPGNPASERLEKGVLMGKLLGHPLWTYLDELNDGIFRLIESDDPDEETYFKEIQRYVARERGMDFPRPTQPCSAY